MKHQSRMEVRYGLSEQHRQALQSLEARAARKPLSAYERGQLAAYRQHAIGEDLERVKRLQASQAKPEPKQATTPPKGEDKGLLNAHEKSA